ncbi:benzoate-CoA ligase family protein [Bradyrhizobium sp. 170]|uniref:benzoate-CoA ligase family protein n=1 Tax=Bradyrhizobium sp. 170 TaxID=2782641 RepID=UPI001FFE6F18|nr:benzoate-CoA ligase family protein [Bradyrhizobium sp. 170]UPK06546.1 benzoate-CoA ligase family protein [Bradyrhizobium sp. 170]
MSGITPSHTPGRSLGPSGHIDDFSRRNLPPSEQWPDLLLDRPEFQYPEYLNAAVELTDRIVENGWGDRIALIGNGRQRTYKELADWSNRLAHALVENYGVKPGNRVLIRSGNNPALVAAWLAATKAGAVVVNTMPMLRAGELSKIVDKAEIALALTDSRIADELVACAKTSRFLKQVVNFDGTSNHDAELDRVALNKPVKFDAVKTGRDDVALLGFTSGTTGEPKATMHFHRDLMIVADGYAKEVLNVTEDDVFVGSPPLAFTFGLGGLAIFPLRFGATATLLENAAPPEMVKIIETYKATICFTSPTAYRAMMAAMDQGADLSSLRIAVSAGETLPAPVFENWTRKTGKTILDGIGSTELLHIFITNRVGNAVAGTTGRPVSGYEAKIVDDDMNELPAGTVGKLAVRGPTGCRYLADKRQSNYVRDGWNLTGDSFVSDANGRLSFVARSDDMIVSSGYNIAGPEVETALLSHPAVAECGVVGAPDEARGMIVKAYVVLAGGTMGDAALTQALQDHVKQTIAPYKYPRAIEYVAQLPKTETGKLRRFALRQMAVAGAASSPDVAAE